MNTINKASVALASWGVWPIGSRRWTGQRGEGGREITPLVAFLSGHLMLAEPLNQEPLLPSRRLSLHSLYRSSVSPHPDLGSEGETTWNATGVGYRSYPRPWFLHLRNADT